MGAVGLVVPFAILIYLVAQYVPVEGAFPGSGNLAATLISGNIALPISRLSYCARKQVGCTAISSRSYAQFIDKALLPTYTVMMRVVKAT